MFFNKNLDQNHLSIENVKDAYTAKLYIDHMIKQTFDTMKPQLITRLKSEGISETEQDDFLKDLYQRIEKKAYEHYEAELNQQAVKNTTLTIQELKI